MNDANVGILADLLKRLQLVWNLFMDSRVPLWTKLVLPLSLVYLVFPADVIPDVIPVAGQMDDLGVILLGMALFVKLCPPLLVEQHRDSIEYGTELNLDEDVIDSTSYKVDRD